ncbi:hypothetical protein Tco_0510770 [Tanacetum coccineum]
MAWLARCGELRASCNLVEWEDMFILYCRRSIIEDSRLTRKINRVWGKLLMWLKRGPILLMSGQFSEILDELMEVVDSSRLNDRMRVWFVQAVTKEEAFARFLRDRCDGLRKSIIVGRDSVALAGLEQMLVGAHVSIRMKEGYVAKMNEDD